MKITFEELRDDIPYSNPIHEIDITDAHEGIEEELLIGLCIEVNGKSYEVVNQITDATENRNITYYVQAPAQKIA